MAPRKLNKPSAKFATGTVAYLVRVSTSVFQIFKPFSSAFMEDFVKSSPEGSLHSTCGQLVYPVFDDPNYSVIGPLDFDFPWKSLIVIIYKIYFNPS